MRKEKTLEKTIFYELPSLAFFERFVGVLFYDIKTHNYVFIRKNNDVIVSKNFEKSQIEVVNEVPLGIKAKENIEICCIYKEDYPKYQNAESLLSKFGLL